MYINLRYYVVVEYSYYTDDPIYFFVCLHHQQQQQMQDGHTNGSSGSSASTTASSTAKNGYEAGEAATTASDDDDDEKNKSTAQKHGPTSWWTWAGYLLLLLVSKYTLPEDLHPVSPTLKHVWYYGWVTALSTGLGAAPLLLAHDMGKQMLGIGNAIASGMMLSASYSLVSEGASVQEPEGLAGIGVLSEPWARVALGVLAGLVFILSTKKVSRTERKYEVGNTNTHTSTLVSAV